MSPWYVPRRIERQRTKGYRLPLNAVYVGRPSRWGNPFRAEPARPLAMERARFRAVENFRHWVTHERSYWTGAESWSARDRLLAGLRELRGRDLACWCPLCPEHRGGLYLGMTCAECAPCHADVLLELANR